MNIRITAVRKASYPDLMAKYENPIEHTCDVLEGQEWISVDGKCPVDFRRWKMSGRDVSFGLGLHAGIRRGPGPG